MTERPHRGGRPAPGERGETREGTTRPRAVEEAAAMVQRTLLACAGPAAAEQIALAQARLAWQEIAVEAGLHRGPMTSRLAGVVNGAARIEVSEAILAAELRLRADALAWAVNRRMEGRPGAGLRIRTLTIVVGRNRPARTV